MQSGSHGLSAQPEASLVGGPESVWRSGVDDEDIFVLRRSPPETEALSVREPVHRPQTPLSHVGTPARQPGPPCGVPRSVLQMWVEPSGAHGPLRMPPGPTGSPAAACGLDPLQPKPAPRTTIPQATHIT